MFNEGSLVKFIGCSKEQIQWGNNSDPTGVLEIGKIYKAIKVEVRSQHTKITLEGIPGRYNSVCFDTP
jgi:hypothetical protein